MKNRDKIYDMLVQARRDVDEMYLASYAEMLQKGAPKRLWDMLANEHKRALHELDARIDIEGRLQKQLKK